MSSKAKNTRTKILDATWKVLETSVPQAVRMSDIARAADLSRQALYLHFSNRTDLIRATRDHIDKINGLEERLNAVWSAPSGLKMLSIYIDIWGSYLPTIKGVAAALLAASDLDEAARAAWDDCMDDHRTGCGVIIEKMLGDGDLAAEWDKDTGTDILWTLLSFQTWNQLTQECGWTTDFYQSQMNVILRKTLLSAKVCLDQS